MNCLRLLLGIHDCKNNTILYKVILKICIYNVFVHTYIYIHVSFVSWWARDKTRSWYITASSKFKRHKLHSSSSSSAYLSPLLDRSLPDCTSLDSLLNLYKKKYYTTTAKLKGRVIFSAVYMGTFVCPST